MQKTWQVDGLKCQACVERVTTAVRSLDVVRDADLDLSSGQLTVELSGDASTSTVEDAVSEAGNYTARPAGQAQQPAMSSVGPAASAPEESYYPLFLVVVFITAGCGVLQFRAGSFVLASAMADFMGLFFVVFGFFKLLNLNGFADAYMSYDLIAARFRGWGLVYPFVELALGLAYLTRLQLTAVNTVTLVVMLIGTAGVARSLLRKQKIQCACLGTVFNLPMSTVTLIEDGGMALMAAAELIM